ncbi:hypothetical protein KHU50_001273 [Colletotrichum sp. SAR 10_65]|nr:hypothetical protein KHU50_001273 [Colletotrichum sp. SAR 10_65]KAI8262143.1 hypothetical protein K4K53_012317 [Colletotrichum sp. SAR 10_77]KAJ5003615.1 hypothetical protein K4K48_011500 [Colletotrichum sp. SAR 10_66]
MPNEDRPHILAPHQPPGTFARLRAKAFADRERKAKEEEARKNNGEKQQKGEEQIKESSSSSSSAPESRPGFRSSLLKPRPVFPGTMNIAILNDDWTLPLDQVDLKVTPPPIPLFHARRQREVYLAREVAAWEQFQYEQEQQGRREVCESASGSKDAANDGVETKGV